MNLIAKQLTVLEKAVGYFQNFLFEQKKQLVISKISCLNSLKAFFSFLFPIAAHPICLSRPCSYSNLGHFPFNNNINRKIIICCKTNNVAAVTVLSLMAT